MEDESAPYRVLVADDHDLIREGTRAMLEGEPDIEVIGEAKDGEEALRLCRSLSPDLILMDVRMPKMDGLEATRAIKAECPRTAVLVVTAYEGEDYLLEAVRAGAAGYVLKEAPRRQQLGAVRRVLKGEFPLNQELAMQLLRRLSDERGSRRGAPSKPTTGEPTEPLPASLSPREVEVLRCLAAGETNRQIAQELHLGLSTVKRHLEHINSKLGVSDRTQAAVRAVELDLLLSDQEEG